MKILRKFIFNGMVLTASSLLLRGLGVGFGAFVSRKLGGDGMGLFTLIMSIYGLAVTVAASGINLAATRMSAEAVGGGREGEVSPALKRCFLYAFGFGSGAAALLFAFAPLISVYWLSDERCTLSLRLLAVSLPFIALSNVLHGYFTAVRKAPMSASTQIFEQIFKIAITAVGLLAILPDISGAADEYRHVEYACAMIVGGGALAEIASFLMALILFMIDRRGKKTAVVSRGNGRRLTRTLFGITLPVAAAAYLRSGLTTVEHILIPMGLRSNPLSADTALAAYGLLCGMSMPIIMFPTALLYSFTGLLVPEFSEARAAGKANRTRYMASRALGMTLIFSLGCAAFMGIFGESLGVLIYDEPEAGRFISVMAPLIPLMYIDHAVDAMLKGLGEQLYCMKVNILDAALSTVLVYFLCREVGIYGYIITIYIAEAMNVTLSLGRFFKVNGFRADIWGGVVKPFFAACVTALVFRLIPIGENLPSLILGGMGAVLFYIQLLMFTGGLNSEEVSWIRAVFAAGKRINGKKRI